MKEKELDEQQIKSTATSKGLAIGASLGVAAKTREILSGKNTKNIGNARALIASGLFNGAIGAMIGSQFEKKSSLSSNEKETLNNMNQDLIRACEMAKYAADMSVPVEQKPAPEVGTDPVMGMTTGSIMESASKAAELAKAKQVAAQAAAMTAPVAPPMKTASITVDDAYEAAYAAEALYEDCLQKMAYAEDLYADCVDYFNGDISVKTASVVSDADAYEAAYAAEALYEDCLQKMAYAEDLYVEADMFIKEAASWAPLAGSVMGGLAGATAGYMNADRFDAPRPGVVAAGAVAGALAGGGLGYGGMKAVEAFRNRGANSHSLVPVR